MTKPITAFSGEYEFLSNFYIAPFNYCDITFDCVEVAYQAAKCPERLCEFIGKTPGQAKRHGRKVPLRADWEQEKYNVMYALVRAKFFQNPDIASMLVATGDAELVEGNYWHDTVWGVCNGVGENHLGKILMRVRDELRTPQHCS